MKKKIMLSILFFVSLIPMFFNQYGRAKGVQEISGVINILNPIGIIAIILYSVGIWSNFKNTKIKKYFPYYGLIGIIISEINNLLTWNYPNTSYSDGIRNCFSMVFPMFYIGLFISVITIIVYRLIDKKIS